MNATVEQARACFDLWARMCPGISWHLIERPDEQHMRVCGTYEGKTERSDVGSPLSYEGMYRAFRVVSAALTKHLPCPVGTGSAPVDDEVETAQRALDRGAGYPVVSRHDGEVLICFPHRLCTAAPIYVGLTETEAAELSRMLAK